MESKAETGQSYLNAKRGGKCRKSMILNAPQTSTVKNVHVERSEKKKYQFCGRITDMDSRFCFYWSRFFALFLLSGTVSFCIQTAN